MTYNVFSGTLNPTHFTSLLVFDFVFSVLAKRLAGNSISKMTYFVLSGCKTLTHSIDQSMLPTVL